MGCAKGKCPFIAAGDILFSPHAWRWAGDFSLRSK